ncbi:hydroxyacid dehydrogenase [Verrucomicrobiota bacterium]
MSKPRIAVLLSKSRKTDCISKEDFNRLTGFSEILYDDSETIAAERCVQLLQDVDACITGWGTPSFPEHSLDGASRLKLIAHSAGSVKALLANVKDSIMQKNIIVTNAVVSLGIAVAEFTLGMILMTMKRAWWFSRLTSRGKWREQEEFERVKEPYGAFIGIIAASNVGRHLIRLLEPFDVTILVYDPYLSNKDAEGLGVRKVPLEELLRLSDVVSIHAPATEQTRHMIRTKQLRLMKPGAILVNTARGSIIHEDELIEELATGRITACLDVIDPEPPLPSSPLRQMPNVILTPHIAGAASENRFRNGRYTIDDLEQYFRDGSVSHPVNFEHWDILA